MLLPALTLAVAGAVPDAEAQPAPAAAEGRLPHSHLHSPATIDESHGPLLLQVTYTGDVIGNVAGGRRQDVRYLDNLDLVFEADLEALAGWTGAQVHVYGLYNNGASISDLAGDVQAVSNIETGVRALRLYEAWIDQKIGEAISLRAGLYDLNSEFDALDSAGLFVGSAHGIGTDIAQTGENGPSIFPSTSLALRLAVTSATGWSARVAILDGVPGDPAHPQRSVVRLGEGDGALLIGELQAPLGRGKLLLGHWRYTASYSRNDGMGSDDGNHGVYLRAELPLWERAERRIDGFTRLGTASGRFNMFDRFASAGLKFSGWVPGRDADEFGIAIAAGFTSASYRANNGSSAAELAMEASYRAQIRPWFALQPNLHYIRHPSANPLVADALVVGLRAEFSFSLAGF